MTAETARALIAAERKTSAAVVTLARLLSLSVRIELELLRTMRLRTMPWSDAGLEADLYFSPLVLTRDASAISLIPEVRTELRQELALRRDELTIAGDVVAAAHTDMDAVILLEEMVTHEALRGDQQAHRSMQRRLGTIARELGGTNADPDLLHWTAEALPRLPLLARTSVAGRELARRVNAGLAAGRGDKAIPSRTPTGTTSSVGVRVTRTGVQFQSPAPSGWTTVELSGPEPIQVEVGWPVPGGWRVAMVRIEDRGTPPRIGDVPLGLLRLRSINGDEVKLRIQGPYPTDRPKLLAMYSGTHLPGDIAQDEADDIEWEVSRTWLPPAGPPRVLVFGESRGDPTYQAFVRQLEAAGMAAAGHVSGIEPGDQWRKRLASDLPTVRASVVLLSRATLSTVRTLVPVFEWRAMLQSPYPVHVLAMDGIQLADLQETLGPERLDLIATRQWFRDPAAIIAALRRELLTPPVDAIAGLLSFASTHWLSRFVDDLRAHQTPDRSLPHQLETLLAASRPVLVRVLGRIVPLQLPPVAEHLTSGQPASAVRYAQVVEFLDGLSHAALERPRQEAMEGRSVLRREMLRAEQAVIAEWTAREGQRPESNRDLHQWQALLPRPEPLKEPFRWTVFVVHASVNRPWAAQLCDALRINGHRLFPEPLVFTRDSRIPQLDAARSASRAGIIIWSEEMVRSSTWFETDYASLIQQAETKAGFTLVVITLDRSPFYMPASGVLHLDFSQVPDGPNSGALLRLLYALAGESMTSAAAKVAADLDEQALSAAAQVRAADAGDHASLLALFEKGGAPWETSPALGCRVAERLIAFRRYGDALAVLEQLEARFDKAVRPRQLRALALLRRRSADDLARAQAVLGDLYASSDRDVETIAMYGRSWMDRYRQSENPDDLRRSRDLYAEAFDLAPDDEYIGINAASKSVLLATAADLESGAGYARRVQRLVGTSPVAGDFWKTATVAEAFLVQRHYAEAAGVYEAALSMSPSEQSSHEATWRQVCALLARLDPLETERRMVRHVFQHLPDCGELPAS